LADLSRRRGLSKVTLRSAMIRSCLIEPLVKPLVGRGRRSALQRSKIAATCLALSALVSVTTNADAARDALGLDQSARPATVKPNAHRAPKIAPRVVLEEFLALVASREDAIVEAPAEAPDFELHSPREGPRPRLHWGGLRLARRLDDLFSGSDPTFRLFGSGQHLSGIPTT
jgi:hypothetical protein